MLALAGSLRSKFLNLTALPLTRRTRHVASSDRRDGGQNITNPALPEVCQMIVQAIHDHREAALQLELQALQTREDLPNYLKPLLPKLLAILQGQRSPTLADDPDLDYDDAAELLLLLEQLTNTQN